ncbi:MAG: aryl-sulfate sulfotransferase [Saprospiraceae bacterium]
MQILKSVMLLVLLVIVVTVFGQRTVGLTNYTPAVSEGYLLFAPFNFNETYLIDPCGDLVQEWQHTESLGTASELLPNGNLLRTERMVSAVNGAGVGGRFIEVDWDGRTVRSIELASDQLHAHHDFTVLPNGNLLVILWEVHDRADAISQGANEALLDSLIWSERVIELAPTANSWSEVWRWRVWDHLVQDHSSTASNFGVVSENPRRLDLNMRGQYVDANLDWLHFNSVTVTPDGKQVILSARSTNEVYIIDHTTTTAEAASSTGGEFGLGGDLLYRYGNDHNYAENVTEPRPLYGQHDARIAVSGPNEGSFSVFNNGVNRPGGEFTSIYRWVPRFDFAGDYLLENNVFPAPLEEEELPLDVSLYSSILSSAQPMETGGYVVNVGRLGAFFEFDRSGEELWRYVSPVGTSGPVRQGLRPTGSTIFQVVHYPVDDPRLAGKNLTPEVPIELDPVISLCLLVGVADAPLQSISVFPNPTKASLTIVDAPAEAKYAQVSDAQGRVVLRQLIAAGEVDLSSIAAGLYSLSLMDNAGRMLATVRVSKS